MGRLNQGGGEISGTQETKARKAKQETPQERLRRSLKEQVVRELGLWDKVRAGGWGGLSAKETGRVGGIVALRLRQGGASFLQSEVAAPLEVVLRTKEGCSLCDKAQAILSRIAKDVPLGIQLQWLKPDSPDAERVPIVVIGGDEVQAGKVSEWRLRNWLRERGYLNATR